MMKPSKLLISDLDKLVELHPNQPNEVACQLKGMLKRAMSGNSQSIYEVGACLDMGDNFIQNKELAELLFIEGAKLGHAHCQYISGNILLNGHMTLPKDEVQGLIFMQKAAEAGHKYALETLGDIFSKGKFGQKVDKELAADYYKKENECGQEWEIPDGPCVVIEE